MDTSQPASPQAPQDEAGLASGPAQAELRPSPDAAIASPGSRPPWPAAILWWAAGAAPRLLAHESCALERARYSAAGLAVLTTAALAAVSGAVVLYHFICHGSLGGAVVGGLAWGLIVLNLDRLLLMTLVKGRNGKSNFTFWVAAPRLGLAALAAVAIAIPAELVLFKGQLDVQVQVDREAAIAGQRGRLVERYAEIPKLEAQRQSLAEEARAAEAAAQAAFLAAACEADGTCGSGEVGPGVLHAEKAQRFEELREAARRARSQAEARISVLDRQLEQLQTGRDRELSAFQAVADRSDDLLTRLIALKHLEKDPTYGVVVVAAGWIVRLLSLCLELLPLTLKLSAAAGPYDAAYEAVQDGEAAQWQVTRERALERADVQIAQERMLGAALKEASSEMLAAAAAEAAGSPAARKARRELARQIVEGATGISRRAAARVFDDQILQDEITAAARRQRRGADRKVVAAERRRSEAFDDLDAAARKAATLHDLDNPLH
jgi:hypothetical protein